MKVIFIHSIISYFPQCFFLQSELNAKEKCKFFLNLVKNKKVESFCRVIIAKQIGKCMIYFSLLCVLVHKLHEVLIFYKNYLTYPSPLCVNIQVLILLPV